MPPLDQPQFTELEPAHWQVNHAGESTSVSARLITNHEAFDSQQTADSVLLLPGYAEWEWALKRALGLFTALGIPAIGATIQAEPVAANRGQLEAFVRSFGPHIIGRVQEQGFSPAATTVFGHSQGAGLAGLTLQETPELVHRLALLEPVGINNHELLRKYPDDQKRYIEYRKRLFSVFADRYDTKIADKGYAGRDVAHQLALDRNRAGGRPFRNKLLLASSIDIAPDVLRHAASHQTVIVLGTGDPLIRYTETRDSLRFHTGQNPTLQAGRDKLTIVSTKQGHSYMGWPDGARHIAAGAIALGLTDKVAATTRKKYL